MSMDWCCIAAVNNDEVMQTNIAASPALKARPDKLTVLYDQPSASVAYNNGLDRTHAEICVFAHQDVYLPMGWDTWLAEGLAQIAEQDPSWAVAGIYGVRPDGQHAGRVWSTGLGRELGSAFSGPVPTVSVDELVIVVRRSSGIRFDEGLPGYHFYGTDIVQIALKQGAGAYIIHAPVVHNSVPVFTLSGAYMNSYHYMRRKWWDDLPIRSTTTRITRLGLKTRWQNFRLSGLTGRRGHRLRMEAEARPRRDPVEIAQMLGYQQ